jgi:hypothetical protein
MNTEMRESTMNTGELTPEELDRVTGGLSLADVATVAVGVAPALALPGGLVIVASDLASAYIGKRL